MSKPLVTFREKHGLSTQELTEILNEKLGPERHAKGKKPLTVGGVLRYESYDKLPKSWVEALGIESTSEESFIYTPGGFAAADDPDTPPAGTDEPPMMPAGGRKEPTIPMQSGAAHRRIEGFYSSLLGPGLALVTGNDGVAEVFAANADNIATAWENAARENAHVEKILGYLEGGGATGELVIAHLMLLVGLLYVSGRIPIAEKAPGIARFKPYHDAAAARRDAADAERAAAEQAWDSPPNGFGPTSPVGDPATVAAA